MHLPRPELYTRIERRVEDMMSEGLLQEVTRLKPYQNHSALKTVGYQELFPQLEGQYGLLEAVDLVKRNSRRYAKRQLTWFRRDGYWKHFRPSELDAAEAYTRAVISKGWHLEESDRPAHLILEDKRQSFTAALVKSSREACYIWPEGQPTEKTLADMLIHELILRAEETGAFLFLPQSLELHLRAQGCIPVSSAELPGKLQKKLASLTESHGSRYWQAGVPSEA